ncbi:MAG: adenylosuccinate synthetase [Mycoplasmatales bacterium]|nr:adenylosuccinate synthetase [Mycoplasmatales bacterium]
MHFYSKKILKAFDLKEYSAEQIYNEYKEYAKILKTMVRETGSMLAKLIDEGKEVIFERLKELCYVSKMEHTHMLLHHLQRLIYSFIYRHIYKAN